MCQYANASITFRWNNTDLFAHAYRRIRILFIIQFERCKDTSKFRTFATWKK